MSINLPRVIPFKPLNAEAAMKTKIRPQTTRIASVLMVPPDFRAFYQQTSLSQDCNLTKGCDRSEDIRTVSPSGSFTQGYLTQGYLTRFPPGNRERLGPLVQLEVS
jgi:hypothetical protein